MDNTARHLQKTYKYRLYPTKQQRLKLEAQLRECCRLYNAALQERREAFKRTGKAPTCYDQTREWTQVRADGNTDLVHYKLGQDVLQRLDRAFDAFFRRVKLGQPPGYPRFKSRYRYDSMTYINYGETPHLDKQGKLILQGIGHLKVRWHRPIEGKTKTCTIKREADRWYVCFSAEYEPTALPCQGRRNKTSTGLDVGLESFATFSNGETIPTPRFLTNAAKKIRRAQRRLERRTVRDKLGRLHGKQSHRRQKARLMLQRAWAEVKNQRRHFHHVEARKLINTYQLIAVEDLNIKNMTASAKGTAQNPGKRVKQKSGLNKAILDAAWGAFLLILLGKAAEAGRIGIKVYAPGTSQECPCGSRVPKGLGDRWHLCLTCGLSVPRDQASAMVIEKRALQQLSA